MQLGQVDTVVLDAFGAGDHERPDALGIVLEVVGERLQGAVSVERQALVTVLKHAHVIEVHMVGVVACAGVRERHLDVAAFRSHEPHVHVLEVAAAAFSVRVRVVAVRLDVVLGDRLAGLVGGEDLGAVGHGDLGRGVGAVVHAHVDRVTLARGQVGELLGDLHVTGQAQHGVVGAFDLGLAGAGDGPVVLEGVLAAVEAGVHDVHAFAPLDGDLLLGALGHDVRGLGLGGQRDLAAGDGDGLLVGLALVGELVHLDGGEVLPILRQGPLGGAALGIPVVQLLIGGLDELAGVHVPQPRQQVGLSALDGVAVARGDRAGRHGDAVERDGAVAVRGVVGVVGATGQDDDVAVVVLQRDLLVAVVDGGILHGGGVERAVDPADDLEVLDELGGHVVRVQVPDVRGVVVASLPAFEVLHAVAAEQRGVRGLAVRRVVADPAVLLVVAQEAHDLRILALHGGTTVGKVGGPVLEGCVILVAGAPFGGHTPAVLVDHLAHLAGFPRVLGAGGVVAPHVEVDEVHVVADLALEVSEAGLAHAGGEIVDAVDADALIQPVPAVAQAATGVATHHVLAEGLGFRVHFGRVDVHAEAGAVLGALLHQGVHVRGAAGAGVDVAVVRMAGVVAFVAVALEQHGLAEAVGVEGDLLDVVKRGQERVLRLGAEVHGDAPCDQLGHFLGLVWVVHDVAVCDRAIFPVDRAVLVLVAGDGDGHLRHVGLFDGVGVLLRVGHDAVVVPRCSAQTEGGGLADLLGGGEHAGVPRTAGDGVADGGAVVLGVGPQAGAQAIARDEAVGVVVRIADRGVGGDVEVGVTGPGSVGRHAGAGELGAVLTGAHGDEALVRERNRLDRVLLGLGLGVIRLVHDLGDVELERIVDDLDLHGDDRVDLVAALDVQRVLGLGRADLLEGHVGVLQRHVGAVNGDDAHVLRLAVHDLAVELLHRVVVHGREVLLHAHVHGGGGERLSSDFGRLVQRDVAD